MKIIKPEKLTYWFTTLGIIVGVSFVISFIGIDLYLKELPFSFSGIAELHRENKILIFVDILSIPIVIFAYIIGKKISENSTNYKNTLVDTANRAEKVYNFIEKLRSGEIDADYEHSGEYDILGKSLINLRDDLRRKENDEQKRKDEDAQRHWATEGLAKFGAILREYSDNLEKLSYNIISNLIVYVEGKQAGFFVLKEENGEKFFEQSAMYAYGRKKFNDKIVKWGEGLVGACALELKTIYLQNTTESYVQITSGLGKSNPRSILIVPLKINDEIYGVIELASFKQYKPYEIEFIEKVAEGIASTISSLKINLRTTELLKDSQKQAVVLAQQDEDMRKNVDALKQTQLEAAKQAEQFISFTNSVNHTMIRAEYSTSGILLYANTKFLDKLEYESNSEVEGKHISMFINDKDSDWFENLWKGLALGGDHFEGDMKHVTKQGKDVWTMATYVSVRSLDGAPEKILFLGIDTTDAKKKSLDYEGQIDALNRSSLKIELSPKGEILSVNSKFVRVMGYTEENLMDKTIFDLINDDEVSEFKIIWENILNGVSFDGRVKRNTMNGEQKWFQGTYSVVHDMYGDVAKIIHISNDITEHINAESKIKQQNEKLKTQEEALKLSKIELSKKLREARDEMKKQFREIETMKMLNDLTLEGMLDAIVTINQDNTVEFFNDAAEELWGYGKEKVIGRKISLILPQKHSSLDGEYLEKYFKYGENTLIGVRTEVYLVNKLGEQIQVLLTLSEAQIGKRYILTAFLQKIEVELF